MMEPWIEEIIAEIVPHRPRIGSQYIWRGKLVKVVDGRFWGEHGISNWWEWREVLPDGSLSAEIHHGYGKDLQRCGAPIEEI